jgi:hypothetical protein
MQEILHRYTANRAEDAIGPAMQVILETVDEVYPVEKADALRASEITQGPGRLSARDPVDPQLRFGFRSRASIGTC